MPATWALGGRYLVDTNWANVCVPLDHEDPEYSCDSVPYSVEVSCGQHCVWAVEHHWLLITPTGLGKLDVTATLRPLDGSAPYRKHFSVDVIPPDVLYLECGRDLDCDEGVRAADPLVTPRIAYREQWRQRGGGLVQVVGTINGRPIPDHPISLADLFPASRSDDGGVVPGTYVIRLSAGGVTARQEIRAHPDPPGRGK